MQVNLSLSPACGLLPSLFPPASRPMLLRHMLETLWRDLIPVLICFSSSSSSSLLLCFILFFSRVSFTSFHHRCLPSLLHSCIWFLLFPPFPLSLFSFSFFFSLSFSSSLCLSSLYIRSEIVTRMPLGFCPFCGSAPSTRTHSMYCVTLT